MISVNHSRTVNSVLLSATLAFSFLLSGCASAPRKTEFVSMDDFSSTATASSVSAGTVRIGGSAYDVATVRGRDTCPLVGLQARDDRRIEHFRLCPGGAEKVDITVNQYPATPEATVALERIMDEVLTRTMDVHGMQWSQYYLFARRLDFKKDANGCAKVKVQIFERKDPASSQNDALVDVREESRCL